MSLKASLTKGKGTSPGADSVSYEMIVNLTPKMKLSLLQIFNKIWLEDVLPQSWKHAMIIPILKPNSYRPISLTSCICKILERIINKRLSFILADKKLIRKEQAASQNDKGTSDHISTLEDAIQEAFTNKNEVLAIFFDIKNAYNMVWRYGILNTLHKWGIGGHLFKFI